MDVLTVVEQKAKEMRADRTRYRNVLTMATQLADGEAAIDAALFAGDLLEVGRLIEARVAERMRETAYNEVLGAVQMPSSVLRSARKEAMCQRHWEKVGLLDALSDQRLSGGVL